MAPSETLSFHHSASRFSSLYLWPSSPLIWPRTATWNSVVQAVTLERIFRHMGQWKFQVDFICVQVVHLIQTRHRWRTSGRQVIQVYPTDGAEIFPQQNILAIIWLKSFWGAYIKYLVCKTQVGLFIDSEWKPSNLDVLTENYMVQHFRSFIAQSGWCGKAWLIFVSCWGMFNLT